MEKYVERISITCDSEHQETISLVDIDPEPKLSSPTR